MIYTPTREDPVSEVKLEQWNQYLEVSGYGSLKERIQMIQLPSQRTGGNTGHYLDQLLWGEMGDFVRILVGNGVGKEGW